MRRLNHRERIDLARRVGFDGAEEVLEGLASKKGGLAPAMLLDAVRKARRADPGELEHLMHDIQNIAEDPAAAIDGLERAADLVDLDEVAESLLTETKSEAEPTAPAVVPPPRPPTPAATPQQIRTEQPKQASPKTREIPPAPKSHDKNSSAEESTQQVPEPKASQPAPTRNTEAPSRDRTTSSSTISSQKSAEPKPAKELRQQKPVDRPSNRPSTTKPTEHLTGPTIANGPRNTASTTNLIGQLKTIRSQLKTATLASLDQVFEQIRAVPDGWPRRRAVTAAIDSYSGAGVDKLLPLVASLETQKDRSWCLAALIRQRDLSGPDLESALALIDSPANRARLGALARRKRKG
ncbi:MAG: hypothetical protein GY906_29180 [bacterium]|nr:hypothetical protein [bacterium]